jgi:hypothetical protein
LYAQGKKVAFRDDAAFAKPELYEALEERNVRYAIRLPANDNLHRNISELLTRPVGRPSHKPVFRFKRCIYANFGFATPLDSALAANFAFARPLDSALAANCGFARPLVLVPR